MRNAEKHPSGAAGQPDARGTDLMAADHGAAMDLGHDDARETAALVRIAVCVVTCRRPDMLARLLEAIGDLEPPPGAEVEVVVVDNDSKRPVRDLVEGIGARLPLPVRYRAEPRPGVSFARNAAIAEAAGADCIAFIDDDMMPPKGWLAALVRAQRATGAAAVTGPIQPAFEHPPPPWLAEIFDLCYVRPTAGPCMKEASAGNLLLDRRAMTSFGLSFAEEFSRLGGEDTQLAADLVAAGLEIAWAPDAIAMEHVPAARMSVGWLSRRWFRYGLIEARVGLRRQPGMTGHAGALARGALRVGAGGLLMIPAALAACRSGAAAPMRRVYTIARGLGMIAGALGWRPRAYGS